MSKKLMLIIVLLAVMCGCRQKIQQSNSESFIEREEKIIDQHKEILVKSGHMAKGFGMDFIILGRYAWQGDGSGYFGAYSFYQPAFEQAKRGWFLHAKVIEGSNELWSQDDEIVFDDSMVGYKVPAMSMSWADAHGKIQYAYFEGARIVKVIDKHELLLDKRAPHHAEQWGMQIVPDDWKDMCACTNNFSPPFVGGAAVVEP